MTELSTLQSSGNELDIFLYLSYFFNKLNILLLDEFKEHLPYYLIVISAIIGKVKESSKQSMFTVWIAYLFGTFFHEVAHFMLSLITFGKPTWFSILPSKSVDATGKIGYTLGYVKSENVRWFNVFFIAMAPFCLIPLSFYVYQYFFLVFNESIYTYILYVFIIVSLLFSSIPSSVDFSILFRNTKVYITNQSGNTYRKETWMIYNLVPPVVIGVLIYCILIIV